MKTIELAGLPGDNVWVVYVDYSQSTGDNHIYWRKLMTVERVSIEGSTIYYEMFDGHYCNSDWVYSDLESANLAVSKLNG